MLKDKYEMFPSQKKIKLKQYQKIKENLETLDNIGFKIEN